MQPKYPPDAYRGFRSAIPDWFIGFLSSNDQQRAVDLLRLRPGDCVCDVACGPGFNLRRLVDAVGPTGHVLAVEDNAHLRDRTRQKMKGAGWTNVQLLEDLDPKALPRSSVDGVLISYNPPIVLQRPDLLEGIWEILKPGGRIALVAGRCTTMVGRVAGAFFVRPGLAIFGHAHDYRYWQVHEPWRALAEMASGRLWVEPRLGFQYLLWAEKAT